MKVGDYITCIKTGYMSYGGDLFAIEGKDYRINQIQSYNQNKIVISSEKSRSHFLTVNNDFFREYFRIKENGHKRHIPKLKL